MPQDIVAPCICGDANCAIPYGFCHCGCGDSAPIALQASKKYGYQKGKPQRFAFGHWRRFLFKDRVRDGHPIEVEGVNCMTIPLTQGKEAIVDCEDYERLRAFMWQAIRAKSGGFYAVRNVRITASSPPNQLRMHRELMSLPLTGGETEVDHWNGNPLDNRRRNLRIATSSQNSCNRRLPRHNRSGTKGVHKNGNGWEVNISVNGKKTYLGIFKTYEEARAKRLAAEKEYHGDFARNSY